MILYNVSVNIEKAVESEWVNWMKNIHIPEVLSTGFFISHKFCKMNEPKQDDNSTTYCIIYECNSEEDLENYRINHAPILIAEHENKFGGKFYSFRSILEVL